MLRDMAPTVLPCPISLKSTAVHVAVCRKASAPVATSLTKVTITRETSVNSQHQDPLPLSAGVGR